MINCGTCCDARVIAKQLWEQDIAQIRTITIVPYLSQNMVHHIAYVSIEMWADSEKAYDIIQQLKTTGEVTIQEWQLRINTHNEGEINVFSYTTVIPKDFYDIIDEYMPLDFENDARKALH
jgi:hypothetical protein